MDALQSLVSAQRRQLDQVRKETGKKWLSRRAIEEKKRKEEDLSIKSATKRPNEESLEEKRKRKEAERLKLLEEHLNEGEEKRRRIEGGASTAGSADGRDSGGLVDEDGIDPTEQREEIFRRLRLLGEPITLFGETDLERYQRLCRLELADHDDDLRGGQQNAFLDTASRRKSGRRQQHDEEDEEEDERRHQRQQQQQNGSDDKVNDDDRDEGKTGTKRRRGKNEQVKQREGEASSTGKNALEESAERAEGKEAAEAEKEQGEDEEELQDQGEESDDASDSEDEEGGDEGERTTKKKKKEMERKGEEHDDDDDSKKTGRVGGRGADSTTNSSLPSSASPETVIRAWLKRMLREWGEDLAAQPEEKKQTAEGRLSSKLHRQSRKELRPLYKKLRSKSLEADVLDKLLTIVKACEERRYRDAHDTYMLLAIGNAAWPMGVTMVGIHERAGRTRIFNSKVAHILNDEATRKYIQIIKRLMSFCQRRHAAEPSQMVTISTLHI